MNVLAHGPPMSPFGIGSTYLSQEKGLASAGVEKEGLPFNAHISFQSSRAHPYTPAIASITPLTSVP